VDRKKERVGNHRDTFILWSTRFEQTKAEGVHLMREALASCSDLLMDIHYPAPKSSEYHIYALICGGSTWKM
jgi:hypothetical protein